ncbi:UDP-forming cellulose synthase catalytic subunit [Fodinicurvata sp. EGI_FJ10296]|uniref:UDP-forming cellulose synthase catalytic subunit n=1 Tax=Fodinicurvata sp. EGI_FJ10296 TaxID=3231908 RepID=UPI003453FC8E
MALTKYLMVLGWIVLLVGVTIMASVPTTIPAQMWLATAMLAMMIIIKLLDPRDMLRAILVALGGFVVLRYLFWRVANTLPPAEQLLDFVPAVLLMIAELYAISILFMGLIVVANPIKRKSLPKIAEWPRIPTVDVFVPSYNEDEEIVEATLLAACDQNYPADKFRVYLCDDGATTAKLNDPDPDKARAAFRRQQTMMALCRRVGAIYLSREDNKSAKAGNLNAAMAKTTGELVAIFDADHVPARDFLAQTTGYFAYQNDLFLVQTPHFFITPDPLERNLRTFGKMPAENEMFYGTIQQGLDKWNASFFCGSAAVLRRTHLDEVNGFSGSSVTEDAESALMLHAKGYKSLYVSTPLIAGLQPESFTEFIAQRSRWAQGMTQIFLLHSPIFKRGLTVTQRIGYANSSMFWFFPFARLAFLIAPLFYLFFGLEIYVATWVDFLAYVLPYIIATLLIQNTLFRTSRWPLISELYEYVQSMFTSRAILGVLLNPRSPSFRVTAKGETLAEDTLSPLARPFIVVFVLTLAGIVATIVRYLLAPETSGILAVVSLWNVFNFMLASAGLGVVCELQQRRNNPRVPVNRAATIALFEDGDQRMIDADIQDASMGGVKISIDQGALEGDPIKPGTQAVLYLEDNGDDRPLSIPIRLLQGRAEGGRQVFGANFMATATDSKANIIRLTYGDSRRWAKMLADRQTSPGVLKGIGMFVRLSLRYSVLGTKFIFTHWNKRQADTAGTAQTAGAQRT